MHHMKKIFLHVALVAIFLCMPLAMSVADTSSNNPSTPGVFSNPLKVDGDVFTVAKDLMEKVVVPIAGVLIVLAIFWSGFMFLMAQGKPEELKKAKTQFLYVLIGSTIILGSWLIMNGIKDTISSLLK